MFQSDSYSNSEWKKCNASVNVLSTKPELQILKKKKPNQLPGLNYWDEVWFQHMDSVEILQYLVPWGLMPLTSQGNLSHTLKILYRNIFKEELFFFFNRKYLKGKS